MGWILTENRRRRPIQLLGSRPLKRKPLGGHKRWTIPADKKGDKQ